MNNIIKTISYYYINPNILYLNSLFQKTKNDLNSNPNILNFSNINYSNNKIKNYSILQPHNITLSNNKKYENKLKVVYLLCFLLVLNYVLIYIQND